MYKKKGRKNKCPDQKEFEYLYYIMDQSAEELAEKYGVKPVTIYNWAYEFRKKDQK